MSAGVEEISRDQPLRFRAQAGANVEIEKTNVLDEADRISAAIPGNEADRTIVH